MNSLSESIQVLRWKIKVHLDKLVHKNKRAVSCVKILVPLGEWVRELKIECSFVSHPKPNHVESHVHVLPGIAESGNRDGVSFGVIVADGELADPPGVLGKGKVEVANQSVVRANWDRSRVYTVSAVACISSHLRHESLKYIRVMH